MTAAADYSFNKSHAACYALISYRTAYLKANYPAEYMAAVISSVMSTKDKVPFFVNSCEAMGIDVLPPDVNSSDHGFVVSGNSIRFGLDAVKNVGLAAVETIIASREAAGPFDSIWDFCERVDSRAVNKRAIECLVKCGALDSTGDTRRGMLEVLAHAQSAGQKAQEDSRRGQGSIFDLGGAGGHGGAGDRRVRVAAPSAPSRPRSSISASCSRSRRRRSGLSSPRIRSPRSATRCGLGSNARFQPSARMADGAWVTVGGIVAEAKKVRTRRGGYVMFAEPRRPRGAARLFVRDAACEPAEALELDRVVVIRGRDRQGGGGQAQPQRARGRALRARRRRARRGPGRRGRGRRPAGADSTRPNSPPGSSRSSRPSSRASPARARCCSR